MQILRYNHNDSIAYRKLEPVKKDKPGIIFLSGFKSDMTGIKALFLEEFSKKEGLGYIRFDYLGHGESSGKFEEGTIGLWLDNALQVLDKLTSGKQILIGSSMGGWLMCLAALKRPERISALVGIASAPDFTEKLLWDKFNDEEKNIIMSKGIYHLPTKYCNDPKHSSYPITKELIEEGRNHLILTGNIDISCPVHLIHGMKDKDVPYQFSLKLAEKIVSDDITIHLSKTGDHRMSKNEDLKIIETCLKSIYSNVPPD